MWEILWWIIVYVILPAALAYLGGTLMAPDEPEGEEPRRSAQSTSWNPRSTQSEGIPRPRAYGKNMHHGNIVSKWTDVDDSYSEILYMVVEHGDGPTAGVGANIVYLNDQPASNFGSVNIQERLGTMDQTVMTGFEKSKLQHNIGTALVYDVAQTFTTPNDFFEDIEYTVSFPQGLYRRQKDGDIKSSQNTLQVRIREVGGSWSDVSPATFWWQSVDPLYYLFKLSDYTTINKGTQYELEFKVTSPQGERHVNKMSLRSVREVLDVPFTRPGKALVGIRAVATSQLSGNIDVKVVRQDRIINVFNGAVWSLECSNNRAWIVWDILTLPCISGNGGGTPYAIERYDGMDPAYLDLNFFHAWSLFCEEEILDGYGGTEARAACNIIVDTFTDTYSLSQRIARVGRANIYWAGDKLTGWIDTVVTTPIDLVTMDNMMFKSWKNNWAIVSELAGVIEVLYQDSRQGYEKTSADYSSEDAGGYMNIVSLEGIGMTSRGPVIHYAKHLVTRNALIRNKNEFRVAKDGFRYSLGNVIRLQSRPANWGQAYIVKSATADTITVGRDVAGDVIPGDVLHIRTYDTGTEQVITDTYTVDSVLARVITITVPWDVAPIKGNLVATGAATDVKLRRITKLRPTKDNYFDVTVETYDPDLFDADDIDPNNPNVNYIWAGANPDIGALVTHADLDDLVAQIIPAQPDINVPWPSNLTWTGSLGTTVAWSKTDADFDITFSYAGTSNIIAADSTTDSYIYWDPASPTVFLSTNLIGTALAPDHWLMCINIDGVVSQPNPQQVIHAAILLAGTIRAETYLELRNTYVYNGDDSLDTANPFDVPFKIVSEMIAVRSVKLSFQIKPYQAYSTAAASGGGQTSGGGGTGWWQTETELATAIDANTDSSRADISSSAQTDMEDLDTHRHTMPQHDHNLSGSTNSEDGTGSHSHDLGFSANVSNEDPGDTDLEDLGNHQHGLPAGTTAFDGHIHSQNEPIGGHKHDMPAQDDHAHNVANHVHGITYGLYEEDNAPVTVHYHIDNGGGYGGPSGNFTTTQTDIDITASITTVGWKSIRFDTDKRCRIAAIIECKLDIDA